MNIFKNPFSDDHSIEVTLLRAYVLFDLATKLVVLSIEQIHDTGQRLGLW
jgi:hypothetical protein